MREKIRMRIYTTIILSCAFFILALAPWIVSNCASQSLVPEEFHRGRERYEATVSAAQEATIEAIREAPSTSIVFVVGTLEASRTPDPMPFSAATATSVSSQRREDADLSLTTPVPESISVLPLPVSTVTPAVTPRQITIRSQAVSQTPTRIPIIPTLQNVKATFSPDLPSGLVDTKDVITEEMLAEQIKADINHSSLSNLTIKLSPDGISAIALITILPSIKQRVEAKGIFAIEEYNLVVKVSEIRLDGLDMTKRYRGQLESSINSSLYRLLPQRYIQSYELANGEITVYSKIKPSLK